MTWFDVEFGEHTSTGCAHCVLHFHGLDDKHGRTGFDRVNYNIVGPVAAAVSVPAGQNFTWVGLALTTSTSPSIWYPSRPPRH